MGKIMKKINYKTIYTSFVLFMMLFYSTPVFAICNQLTGIDSDGGICYIRLEPSAFPALTTSSSGALADFLGQVFNFGIAAAVVLALIMIIWGGIIKMTTDSWEGNSEANEKITNALYGLGLALGSWLILFTINPCLVDFTGTQGCATRNTFLSAPSSAKLSTNTGTGKVAVNASLYDNRLSAGIKIVSSGNCFLDRSNPKCTTLAGMPGSVITGLNNLSSSCGGNCITITGGTETGHLSHGENIANVDVRYSPEVIEALKVRGLRGDVNYQGRPTYTCEPATGGSHSVPCGPNAGVIHIQF